MYLYEVAKLINRTDVRPTRNWCKKNGLVIYKDSSGEFVFKNDFDIAYDLPLIRNLKSQHGDSWETAYQAYTNNELYKFVEVNQNVTQTNSTYVPKGTVAKKLIFNKQNIDK